MSDEVAKTGARPVRFTMERLPSFQCYHSDGAWLTVNGDDLIQINYYSEQPKVPGCIVMQVKPNGDFTGEHEILGDDPRYYDVRRDIICGVTLNLRAARQIRDAINNFLDIAKSNAPSDQK